MADFEEIIKAIGIKPYYRDEWCAIYHADCRDILPLIPDKSIDLVLTSPPYDDLRSYFGNSFDFINFKQVVACLTPKVTEGGVVVWVIGDAYLNGSESGSSFKQALHFMDIGFRLHDTMIYVKDTISSPQSNRYNQMFEYMFVFTKGKPNTFNPIKVTTRGYKPSRTSTRRKRGTGELEYLEYEQGKEYRTDGNIWFYGVGYKKSAKEDYIFEHPAIFPEALASDHIISWSNQGDLVLDPFLGSGTTCYCAKKLNRYSIGIEIEEKYCEIAAKRCSQGVMRLEI